MVILRTKLVSGFTLLEILLSVAVIGVISGIGIPIYQTFKYNNDMGVASDIATQSFRRAQLLAQASDGDSQWGVRSQSGSITVFKGATYAGRDSAYDEDFSMPATLSFSGLTEVVYAKMTGFPTTTGTLTITALNNQTTAIVLNAKGMVE